MSFRPTEYTVRQLLIEELCRRGVKVTPEISFVSPVGRLVPDLLLQNGGCYVVETKLGAESKLMNAVLRLYDYSKFAQARGAFAILFPEELRRPWPPEVLRRIAADPRTQYTVMAIFRDFRPSQSFRGNLSEVADWIAGHVLKVPLVEADTGLAIRVLREAVDFVTASVRMLKGEELEDIFGGRSVFENILQYEEGRYPVEQMREAATYLLINQLLFYHVLSSIDVSFPGLDEDKIERPADLARYFEPVLKRNYSSIFGFDVASRLPDRAVDVIRKVVMVIKALAPERIRHDVLGKVFHELIPFEVRKAVAAFYTNNEAAEILAQLAIDRYDAKVMDLAVGSGTLLVAAYRRKRELLKQEKGFVDLEKMHRKFLEEDLTGIDIMPFAAHLAVVHLSLQGLLAGFESEKIRIAVWDSTELKPGDTIPAISKELRLAYRRPTLEMFMKGKPSEEEAYVKKGVVTLEGIGGEEIKLEKADVVIMNPPFTRHQRIPKHYKRILAQRFSDQSNYIHGQMGYHGYFILLANRFVKEGGRLALVLPASVLNADGFSGVRKLLTNDYHIEHIITTWQRAAFSEGAQFREILLVAKKKRVSSEDICVLTELKKLPKDLNEARKMAEKIKQLMKVKKQGIIYNDDKMQISVFSMEELRKSVNNLFKFISFLDKELLHIWVQLIERAGKRLIRFGDYIEKYGAGPIEGAALGQVLKKGGIGAFYVHTSSSRMLKKTDVWILKEIVDKEHAIIEHKTLKTQYCIPLECLCPAIRRFSGLNMLDISQKLDYVICKNFPDSRNFTEISLGKEVDAKFWTKWENYIRKIAGNLLMVNHADFSAPGTSILAYYSGKPTLVPRSMWSIKVPNNAAKVFSLWLNSTFGLLQMLWLRRETRGAYLWFVASTIRDFLVPNPEIPESEQLIFVFDKFRRTEFPSILNQLKNKFPGRLEIDRTLMRVLGFNDDEIEKILDFLYPALANEIEQLKALMKG